MQAVREVLLALVHVERVSLHEGREWNHPVDSEREPARDHVADEPEYLIGVRLAARAVALARPRRELAHALPAHGRVATILQPAGRHGRKVAFELAERGLG